MNIKPNIKLKAIMFSLCAVVGISISQVTFSDDDDHKSWKRSGYSKSGVAMVNNELYLEECGSCHFAYQPGLLPESSWKQLMATLEDHFEDNAELDEKDQKTIAHYLYNNSADKSTHRRSTKIMRSLRRHDNIVLRITEIPYFKREHREIPDRLITANKQVASLSNCNACHTKIDKGSFRESEINIAGYGYWDD